MILVFWPKYFMAQSCETFLIDSRRHVLFITVHFLGLKNSVRHSKHPRNSCYDEIFLCPNMNVREIFFGSQWLALKSPQHGRWSFFVLWFSPASIIYSVHCVWSGEMRKVSKLLQGRLDRNVWIASAFVGKLDYYTPNNKLHNA